MTKKLLAVAISAALMGSVGFTTSASADEGSHSFPAQCWHPAKNVLKDSASNHPGVCDEAIEHSEAEHSGETSGAEEGESTEAEVENEVETESEVENEAETEEEVESETEEETESVEENESEEETEVEVESELDVEIEGEVEIEVSVEEVIEELSESGEILDADATIEALDEEGLTISDLPEDLQDELPITDDPVEIAPETSEESETSEEPGTSEELEIAEEPGVTEEPEVTEEPTNEEESAEIPTEVLAPEDVEENTFSMGLTVEEQEVIETQLEVVEEVVVGVDEAGNEITSEVQDTQVIGEVLVPSEDAENADEDGVNALLFGEPVNIDAELGVAEATVVNGETQILTTVTGVEMNEVSEDVDAENINTEETINLDVDEDGNVSLTIPNLQIGDLTVNVKLRALTDALDVYQVQEVTVAPEEVFVPEAETQPEEPVVEESVAEEPVAEEPAEEPVVEEPVVAEEPAVEEPAEEPVAEEPVVEELTTEEPVV